MMTYHAFGPVPEPEWLKGDDNHGNVYAVRGPYDAHPIGYVFKVSSSRTWVGRFVDGSLPPEIVDAATMTVAATLLGQQVSQQNPPKENVG